MHELRELAEIAEFAAQRAGAALKRYRADWSGVASEEGREVKVDADVRAEAMILETLQKFAPYPIISEEAGWIKGEDSTRVWAVDPLDGSVNYIQGYPQCAVSIALLENNKPIIGVVDSFLTDERFTGIVGHGAALNGAQMAVSKVTDAARGIICTGIPARARTDAAAMDILVANMKAWRKVRMIGSAAMALAYVASARADAYRESGSMIWDIAGGCALVAAAGGFVEIIGDDLGKPLEVTATNGLAPKPA
ncbi:MAG: inositol monophosphatase family protein [Caulobacterales bacterium]